MFRDGKQVPVFITTDKNLEAGDYIEFYGEKNDGQFDSRLYQEEDGQLNSFKSLFNDTSTYYLTWNNESVNDRIQNVENDVSLAQVLPQESYFMHEVLLMPDKKNQSASRFSQGKPDMLAYRSTRSQSEEQDILSPYNFADFERGEGLVDSIIDNSTRKYGILTPALFSGINAPLPKLEIKVVGRNDDVLTPDHHIRVNVNGVSYLDEAFDGFETPTYTMPILSSDICRENDAGGCRIGW